MFWRGIQSKRVHLFTLSLLIGATGACTGEILRPVQEIQHKHKSSPESPRIAGTLVTDISAEFFPAVLEKEPESLDYESGDVDAMQGLTDANASFNNSDDDQQEEESQEQGSAEATNTSAEQDETALGQEAEAQTERDPSSNDDASQDTQDNTLSDHASAAREPETQDSNESTDASSNSWNMLTDPPSCSDEDWFAKYLWYRLRLRGDRDKNLPGFISVGDGAGQSLPPNFRDPHAECASDWNINHNGCFRPEDNDAQGKLKYGDTSLHLGYYIAMLASEYKSFSIRGVDTSQTLLDLYYALEAFNRLDRKAEEVYGLEGVEDGFFLRDDVPGDFATHEDGSFRFPHEDPNYNGYACIESAYSCGTPHINDGNFVSQDQMLGMMFGLSFVKKFIPNDIIVEGVDLQHEAKAIAHRMLTHLLDNDWKITDPEGNHPPARWGGSAKGSSFFLAEAANIIAGDTFGIDDYHDGTSRTIGALAVAGLDVSFTAQIWYNKGMALEMASVTDVWNNNKMARKAQHYVSPFYAYVHAVLNDGSVGSAISDWQISTVLNGAACNGPCNETENCDERDGWRGDYRWRNPVRRNGYKWRIRGEYNGIDYMLMHNIFNIYHNGDVQGELPPIPRPAADVNSDLEDLIEFGANAVQSYDPEDAYNAKDMHQRFCGRSFFDWINLARQNKVSIHTGKGTWQCPASGACNIISSNGHGDGSVDLIIGTNAAETIKGKGGNDCIYAFGGNDTIKGGQGADEIHAGDGNDDIYGESAGINLDGEADLIYGDAGNDFVRGGPGYDSIYGNDGQDTLVGGTGWDYLFGGKGNDTLKGGSGQDFLDGGDDDDELRGGAGDDVLRGQRGHDKLDADAGDDILYGDDGNDFLKGGTGDDKLVGGSGDDRMCGNGGDDSIYAESGNDDCRGGWGDDKEHHCENDIGHSKCTQSAFNNY